MTLHNEIMNLNIKSGFDYSEFESKVIAYKYGHRDARHQAAELSLKYESLIEKLFDALCDRHADDYVDELRSEYNL